jgi:serine/threonine protein kinase
MGMYIVVGDLRSRVGGIGYAHRAGLVHCDVKPQNMLVTPNQRLKVLGGQHRWAGW